MQRCPRPRWSSQKSGIETGRVEEGAPKYWEQQLEAATKGDAQLWNYGTSGRGRTMEEGYDSGNSWG